MDSTTDKDLLDFEVDLLQLFCRIIRARPRSASMISMIDIELLS